jgi:hypothetical protein
VINKISISVLVDNKSSNPDLLEEHGLARLRGRDDERALTLAQRVDQVDQALRQVLGVRFEVDQLDRVDGRQRVEVRPASGGLRIDTVDRLDMDEAPILLAVLGLADDTRDAIAGT